MDSLEKRKRLSTILMLATMGVLLIYGLVSWKEGADSEALRRFTSSPNKMLLDHVEKAYFPGFSYAAKNRRFSAGEWVAEQAMHMIPLGSYVAEKEDTGTDIEDKETYEMILAKQAADENAVDENGNLIGGEEEQEAVETSGTSIDTSLEKLKNYEYLLGNFYTVDSTTMTSPEELDAEALLAKDMKIDTSTKEPKVLIYHTHSQEGFVDSVEGDAHHPSRGGVRPDRRESGQEQGLRSGGAPGAEDTGGQSEHRGADRSAQGRCGGRDASCDRGERKADGADYVL